MKTLLHSVYDQPDGAENCHLRSYPREPRGERVFGYRDGVGGLRYRSHPWIWRRNLSTRRSSRCPRLRWGPRCRTSPRPPQSGSRRRSPRRGPPAPAAPTPPPGGPSPPGARAKATVHWRRAPSISRIGSGVVTRYLSLVRGPLWAQLVAGPHESPRCGGERAISRLARSPHPGSGRRPAVRSVAGGRPRRWRP